MTTSLVALCLFAGWTVLLVTSLATYRGLFASRLGRRSTPMLPTAATSPASANG